jgi:DNA (cytosine-5)-methyltransferase 1
VAAGHATIRADVRQLALAPLAGVVGLIGSPPCQAFSVAGSRDGLADVRTILSHAETLRDARAWLEPAWIALEQVPPVLPIWAAFADVLEEVGYRTWTGLLNAADYGVPQTRTRAILTAHWDDDPTPPPASHAREPHPVLFGDELEPWVSMASALGWDGFRFGDFDQAHAAIRDDSQPAPTIPASADNGNYRFRVGFPRRDENNPDEYRERDFRDGDEPAQVVTEKARSWTIQVRPSFGAPKLDYPGRAESRWKTADDPAPAITGTAGSWAVNTGRHWKLGGVRADAQTVPLSDPAPTVDGRGRWFASRPATTVCADPRIHAPGHKDENRRTYDGSIRLELADVLVLQSFRPDYPLVGTKTSRFRQVGNAVPPLLAYRILEPLL